jgi:hypothetical protein
MTSREQFEQFRDTRNALLEAEGHKPGSKWHVTQAHYATWEASRADIEVELKAPHTDYDNYTDSQVSGACKYYEQARRHIKAAGLRLKPC